MLTENAACEEACVVVLCKVIVEDEWRYFSVRSALSHSMAFSLYISGSVGVDNAIPLSHAHAPLQSRKHSTLKPIS